MRRNYVWALADDDGVRCLEYDGYFIELSRVVNETGFFATHIAEKTWGTPQVVRDFVDCAIDLARSGVQ